MCTSTYKTAKQPSSGNTTGDYLPPFITDRRHLSAREIVQDIWVNSLKLPSESLVALDILDHDGPVLPSSYRIGIFAQSTIATSALAASLLYCRRNQLSSLARVSVPIKHAAIEFKSERLYTLNNQPPLSSWGAIGGLHKTADGFIRVHDVFPNHVSSMLNILRLPSDTTREQVATKIANWASVDLEDKATAHDRAAAYALRSYAQWDELPQSKEIGNKPVLLERLQELPISKTTPRRQISGTSSKTCLEGVRVLEMSRVIAAPVAGKALAAHNADVLWVTSPNLPDLPDLDRDLARGKRTIQLDIHNEVDKQRLMDLLRTCDVFIQSFRPGSLAAYGLGPEELVRLNPNIICANLSAFGPKGPWSGRRGFDSLVQTCSGMNLSEAEHANTGEFTRATPCQALDHASGYLLASGIMAALYHRDMEGGAWKVDVSLARAMQYLRSLGQYPGTTGFDCRDYKSQDDLPGEYLETRETGFGLMTAVKHSATIQGCDVGWREMPKPLGSDMTEWK
ncbi:uncharacterized protein GIQ15_05736 [Arthroderma uncinatum]|uniref:uncharacterized protein n=1 Tax=Arthroderma uncinatum TaxID=74035 RepID=UPI00144A9B3C|nr:uncharacterized protein GIQ15_05736 [Arthroderma uncinatum]KAF3480389.1 hypothetical protein GIQ15_05736 [Arthroderma uncinatum]